MDEFESGVELSSLVERKGFANFILFRPVDGHVAKTVKAKMVRITKPVLWSSLSYLDS